MPPADRSKMTYHKCGTIGHFAAQCFVKTQHLQQGPFQTRPPQPVRNIQEEQPQLEEKLLLLRNEPRENQRTNPLLGISRI